MKITLIAYMIICHCCSAQNPDDANFCHMCGKNLKWEKILDFIKDYYIIIIGTLGMLSVIFGSLLLATLLWFGISLLLIGGLLMTWAILAENKMQ